MARSRALRLMAIPAVLMASLLATVPLPAFAEPFSDFDDAFAASADRADTWQTGWTAFYVASLGFNGYRGSEASDGEDRYDARVSAVTSAMALGDLLINPLPRQYEDAERRYSGPEGEKRIVLQIAQSENAAYRWESRVLPGIVSAAAGLVIGIGDDRPGDGLLQFATSMAVNEVKLWTRPRAVRNQLDAMHETAVDWGGKRHTLLLSGYVAPGGLGFLARF